MSGRQRLLAALSWLAGIVLVALLFTPLFVKGMSPVTQGVMIGIAGMFCLAGVAFGVWDARRIEAKRKAKEEIWMKH